MIYATHLVLLALLNQGGIGWTRSYDGGKQESRILVGKPLEK